MNRGRCIKMADSLSGIQTLLKRFNEGIFIEFKESEKEDLEKKEEEKNRKEKKYIFDISSKKYKSATIILQKYLEKPLLYWGRKFDIRVWVLISHKFEIFAFK